jgi:5-methylcytosine-specific restriction endonuclease McrA
MPKKPPRFRPPGQVRYASERERKATLDRRRPSRQARGYDAAWFAVRNAYVAVHPFCCVPGCGAPADEVDHIASIRDRPDLRLEWSNLRALCRHHHSQRTARDHGFARRATRD